MTYARPLMTDLEQFAALNVLQYVSELFAGSPKTFTGDEVSRALELVKHDPELFDPLVVAAQEEATQSMEVVD